MKASQRHELEKDRMDTLQASGVSTSTYHGDSLLDGEQSSENNDDYDERMAKIGMLPWTRMMLRVMPQLPIPGPGH